MAKQILDLACARAKRVTYHSQMCQAAMRRLFAPLTITASLPHCACNRAPAARWSSPRGSH